MDDNRLKDLREDYSTKGISKSSMLDDPFQQFTKWLDVVLASNQPDSNAMVLTTSSKNGKPSSRVVLLKEMDGKGFYFYSNYESRKGMDLAENPQAQLLFVWLPLHRQIRIGGKVHRISRKKSEEYFYSRPLKSQIGAAVSAQSHEIENWDVLEKAKKELEGQKVDMPENWGGYCLIPDYFEFWQGRSGRLHDRICYEKIEQYWRKFRIAP